MLNVRLWTFSTSFIDSYDLFLPPYCVPVLYWMSEMLFIIIMTRHTDDFGIRGERRAGEIILLDHLIIRKIKSKSRQWSRHISIIFFGKLHGSVLHKNGNVCWDNKRHWEIIIGKRVICLPIYELNERQIFDLSVCCQTRDGGNFWFWRSHFIGISSAIERRRVRLTVRNLFALIPIAFASHIFLNWKKVKVTRE